MSKNKPTYTAADLIPGQTYHLIAAFTDYDGVIHPVGEIWRFIEKYFLPYEDGLSLRVEKNGQDTWIRLQWRTETQGQVIENFSYFVEAV